MYTISKEVWDIFEIIEYANYSLWRIEIPEEAAKKMLTTVTSITPITLHHDNDRSKPWSMTAYILNDNGTLHYLEEGPANNIRAYSLNARKDVERTPALLEQLNFRSNITFSVTVFSISGEQIDAPGFSYRLSDSEIERSIRRVMPWIPSEHKLIRPDSPRPTASPRLKVTQCSPLSLPTYPSYKELHSLCGGVITFGTSLATGGAIYLIATIAGDKTRGKTTELITCIAAISLGAWITTTATKKSKEYAACDKIGLPGMLEKTNWIKILKSAAALTAGCILLLIIYAATSK